MQLSAINRFPVKSCRGEAVTSALVEPWGLAGDRRWMVVDETGCVVTAREVPNLLLVRPRLVGSGLRLEHPDLDGLAVDTPDGRRLVDVSVWGSTLLAAVADAAAHAWISTIVGAPARLVYLDDPTRRPTNPAYTLDSDRVSFADGYPLLLASEASLTELNRLLAEGPLAHEGPLPMTRFRPSVVVRGSSPWEEDGWRRVRIGAAAFRVVKGCDRCVITTTDAETAARGKEPIATLARHRRWDGKTWFAVNLVPDTPGVRITVGDEVEVLERADSSSGPLR